MRTYKSIILFVLGLVFYTNSYSQLSFETTLINVDTLDLKDPYEVYIKFAGSDAKASFVLTRNNLDEVKSYLDSVFSFNKTDEKTSLKEQNRIDLNKFKDIYEVLVNRLGAIYTMSCATHKHIYCSQVLRTVCDDDCNIKYDMVLEKKKYFIVSRKSNKVIVGLVNAQKFNKTANLIYEHPCEGKSYCYILFATLYE